MMQHPTEDDFTVAAGWVERSDTHQLQLAR
jgi:hypothetical protein